LGRWRYRRGGDGRPASVETRLVRDLTGDEHDGIDAEVRRFATFVGRDVEWR
ncbi:MAG: hypothetical protein QOK15_2673, partial [Nocardioidaceae bacterium]|nr:hypothetical protein [Nocardioidaceae bacterium]